MLDATPTPSGLRQAFGSLASYFWRFEPPSHTRPQQIAYQALRGMTTSPEAMGLVNDHIEGCSARVRASDARAALGSPHGAPPC